MSYQAVGGAKTDLAGLEAVNQYITEEVPGEINFPFKAFVNARSLRSAEVYPQDPTKVDASRMRTMSINSMSGLQDHISVSGGNITSDSYDGNVLEALMLEEAMYRQDLHVGDVMEYPVSGGAGIVLKVKIVGTFQPTDETDPYWYQGFEGMMNSFFVNDVITSYSIHYTKLYEAMKFVASCFELSIACVFSCKERLPTIAHICLLFCLAQLIREVST